MTPLRIVIVILEAPVPFGNAAARWFYVLLRELVARIATELGAQKCAGVKR